MTGGGEGGEECGADEAARSGYENVHSSDGRPSRREEADQAVVGWDEA